MKTIPITIRHLIALTLVLAFSALRVGSGELLPEDSISKDYWQGLDPKAKIVFLTGYRHAQGPVEEQKAQRGARLLAASDFSTLVAKLDKFYENDANKHVFVSAAIRICFMEVLGKPQKDIDDAVTQARKAFFRL